MVFRGTMKRVSGVCCTAVMIGMCGVSVSEGMEKKLGGENSPVFSSQHSLGYFLPLALGFKCFVQSDAASDPANWPYQLSRISSIISYLVEGRVSIAHLCMAQGPIGLLLSPYRLEELAVFCSSKYCILDARSTVIKLLHISSALLSFANVDSVLPLKNALDVFLKQIDEEEGVLNLLQHAALLNRVASTIDGCEY